MKKQKIRIPADKKNNALKDQDNRTTISGSVCKADGTIFAGMTVRVYDRELRSEELLGEAITDKDGKYEIDYSSLGSDQSRKQPVNPVLRVYEKGTRIIAESEFVWNPNQTETVNIIIGTFQQATDYTKIQFTNELSDLTGNHAPLMEELTKKRRYPIERKKRNKKGYTEKNF